MFRLFAHSLPLLSLSIPVPPRKPNEPKNRKERENKLTTPSHQNGIDLVQIGILLLVDHIKNRALDLHIPAQFRGPGFQEFGENVAVPAVYISYLVQRGIAFEDGDADAWHGVAGFSGKCRCPGKFCCLESEQR